MPGCVRLRHLAVYNQWVKDVEDLHSPRSRAGKAAPKEVALTPMFGRRAWPMYCDPSFRMELLNPFRVQGQGALMHLHQVPGACARGTSRSQQMDTKHHLLDPKVVWVLCPTTKAQKTPNRVHRSRETFSKTRKNFFPQVGDRTID